MAMGPQVLSTSAVGYVKEHGHAMGLLEQGPGGHRAERCLTRRHLPEGSGSQG